MISGTRTANERFEADLTKSILAAAGTVAFTWAIGALFAPSLLLGLLVGGVTFGALADERSRSRSRVIVSRESSLGGGAPIVGVRVDAGPRPVHGVRVNAGPRPVHGVRVMPPALPVVAPVHIARPVAPAPVVPMFRQGLPPGARLKKFIPSGGPVPVGGPVHLTQVGPSRTTVRRRGWW